MHVMYFTEQPMSAYPAKIGLRIRRHRARSQTSSPGRPAAGSTTNTSKVYIYAEEMGVEGFMLNEHQQRPFCMQAKCNIFASILAAVTKKAKIVLLGNPLPLAENPVRLAEELAMIDMISKAPGLGLRARRRPGATRQRGQPGLQPRAVRGSARPGGRGVTSRGSVPLGGHALSAPCRQSVGGPFAKAHPRARIPGVLSKETIIWGGAWQRYPYIALNTSIEATKISGRSTTRWPRKPATSRVPRTAAIQQVHVGQ